MDVPTPSPPTPTHTPAAPVAAAPDPHVTLTTPPTTSRSAQAALGLFLAVTLCVLAYRGYGNGIGVRPTETAAAPITNLNLADRAELEQVPGIGPSLARAIEDHRSKKGPFKSVEELRQVKGVGPATLDKVRPFLRVDPVAFAEPEPASIEPLVLERKPPQAAPAPAHAASGARKLQPGDPPLNLNTATLDDLTRLPGVGPVTAQHIITARTERAFATVDDLRRVKGIGPKTLEKLKPFLVVK